MLVSCLGCPGQQHGTAHALDRPRSHCMPPVKELHPLSASARLPREHASTPLHTANFLAFCIGTHWCLQRMAQPTAQRVTGVEADAKGAMFAKVRAGLIHALRIDAAGLSAPAPWPHAAGISTKHNSSLCHGKDCSPWPALFESECAFPSPNVLLPCPVAVASGQEVVRLRCVGRASALASA